MSYILAPNKEMLTPLLTSCLRTHRFCLRAYLVLRGAYAGLRAPQFCLRHSLTRSPLLNMNTRVLKRGSHGDLWGYHVRACPANIGWPCQKISWNNPDKMQDVIAGLTTFPTTECSTPKKRTHTSCTWKLLVVLSILGYIFIMGYNSKKWLYINTTTLFIYLWKGIDMLIIIS